MKLLIATALTVLCLGCASSGASGSNYRPCLSESTLPLADAEVTKGFALIGGLSGLLDRLAVPASTRKASQDVRVVVTFIVDEKGCTRDYVLAEGSDMELAEAVVNALQRSAFIPAELDGIPVPIKGSIPVTVK
jgi:TonB family protein